MQPDPDACKRPVLLVQDVGMAAEVVEDIALERTIDDTTGEGTLEMSVAGGSYTV